MTKDEAWKLASHWAAAWNSHDLDSIMTHYDDAVELTSPAAAQLLKTADGNANILLPRSQKRDLGHPFFLGEPDLGHRQSRLHIPSKPSPMPGAHVSRLRRGKDRLYSASRQPRD
jgi:hypothetical protein